MVSCKSREAANPQQGNKRRRFVLPLNWHLPLDGPRAPRDQVQVVGRVPEQNARCRFGELHAALLRRALHARRGIDLRRGARGERHGHKNFCTHTRIKRKRTRGLADGYDPDEDMPN